MKHLRPAAHHNQRGGGGVRGGTDRNSSMLPDLEDVPDFEEEGESRDKKKPFDSNRKQRNRQRSRWDDEIEPAFLRDEDYPKDWLVFHPKYGVITKAKLDQLKRTKKSGKGVA
eukprot:CAMPEP_0185741496 /NCGR_PEP_ID=MMETSP1171-20130828/38990_1 /TAXON_ID=374046 /ORGANISM="Helicotheca tamensis, Strain CCMP826" /LENGTH=112 /DNA_ID=CAMNT_0028413473 /DNA_START=919 /DNA_END=1257 /DNA_ORIENTATION=+